jgi:hypothetical protein
MSRENETGRRITFGYEPRMRVYTVERQVLYARCDACGWLSTGNADEYEAIDRVTNHVRRVHGFGDLLVERVDWQEDSR